MGLIRDFNQYEWCYHRDLALVTLIYGTGLGLSEALSISKSDIYNKEFILVKGKGGKERMVPILPIILKRIDKYLKICPYGISQYDPIFLECKGAALITLLYFKN